MLAIEVKGLVKKYPNKTAVAGINLEVRTGEIFALLGPNGAGKTTTVEILEGYRDRDGGTVQVLNEDPGNLGKRAPDWRNKIGIVLQSTKDAEDLSVEEVLFNFAKYYENPRDPSKVIVEIGLEEKRTARINTLSGGQRRRLDVGLGIIGNPQILFLDEPTTGFDPEARRLFWDLIRKLRDEGSTILLTTHYLDEAEALADRVAVIADGRIIEVASPHDLGGRKEAHTEVIWIENGLEKRVETDSPTELVKNLSEKFTGEIPGLQIKRPTLEDIYLKMVGEKND